MTPQSKVTVQAQIVYSRTSYPTKIREKCQ